MRSSSGQHRQGGGWAAAMRWSPTCYLSYREVVLPGHATSWSQQRGLRLAGCSRSIRSEPGLGGGCAGLEGPAGLQERH
jgi:hypothetical protein